MNLLREGNIVILQYSLHFARPLKSGIFLASDKISAQPLAFTRQILGVLPPGADPNISACWKVSSERRVQRHAAALRKASNDYPLWIDRIFLQDLLVVERQICESHYRVIPAIRARS